MSGVLYLRNVLRFAQVQSELQLVIDGFDDSPLSEQPPVQFSHRRTLHVAHEFGNELYPVHKEFPEELLAEVSLVTDEFAVEEICEMI